MSYKVVIGVTLDQKDALEGANAPDSTNVFATLADVGGGGSNIGTSDLTISATGTRKLQMFGGLTTDAFNLRNHLDTRNLFSFSGDGTFTIGLGANNSGGSSLNNVVIGGGATNNGLSDTTIVGNQAFSTHFGGTAIGKDAQVLSNYGTSVGNLTKSGLNSVAIGLNANASAGQYNIAIGELSSCTAFFGVAIGRNASAGDRAVAVRGTAGTYGTAVNGASGAYAVSVGSASNTGSHGTAIGYNTDCTTIGVALGRGMETSGIYSVSIGACPYGSTRLNTVANTFNWFTNNANPVVRLGETADQWNIGTGSFGYGTMTPDASAVIDLTSTTKGILLPRMTTAERDAIAAPAESVMLYDTDLNRHHTYDGTNWKPIGSLFGYYAQTVASATVTNTTTETSIVGTGVGALTVPANNFQVGDSFHAKIGGVMSALNNDTVSLHIKTGATVLATTGVITLEAVTALGWEMELDFTIGTIGAVGSMCTNGNFAYNRNTGALEGFVFQDVQAIDTTVINTLDITVTWGVAKTADQIYSANFVLYKTF